MNKAWGSVLVIVAGCGGKATGPAEFPSDNTSCALEMGTEPQEPTTAAPFTVALAQDQPKATFTWTVSGGTITAGQGTATITVAGAPAGPFTAEVTFGGETGPTCPPSAKAVVDVKQSGATPAEAPSPERGKQLFETMGCIACHTIDGSPRVGPSLKGTFGTQVTLETGASVLFDEAYFRESVLSPQAKVHAGFPPVQPSYEGQLTDRDLAALLAYIRSL